MDEEKWKRIETCSTGVIIKVINSVASWSAYLAMVLKGGLLSFKSSSDFNHQASPEAQDPAGRLLLKKISTGHRFQVPPFQFFCFEIHLSKKFR